MEHHYKSVVQLQILDIFCYLTGLLDIFVVDATNIPVVLEPCFNCRIFGEVLRIFHPEDKLGKVTFNL